MKNAFSRSEERYGDSTPGDTPFRRAAQVWDHRLGSATSQARSWRLMAFGGLALTAASLAGVFIEHQTQRIATYVVPINEYGRPGRVELAGRGYTPSEAELAYFVSDWVRLVRSKSTDPVVLRQNWTSAYHFVAAEAAPELDAYARAHDPFERVGQEAINVEIVSVLPRSPRTFQVNWREAVYSQGGRAEASNWTGLVTTTLRPPKTEADLKTNPLGLLITAFQWSREL